MTVSVQSLEDVMKVLTTRVPNRLEANVQPVTAAEAEKIWHSLSIRRSSSSGSILRAHSGRAGLAISDFILQVDNQPIEGLENFISVRSIC